MSSGSTMTKMMSDCRHSCAYLCSIRIPWCGDENYRDEFCFSLFYDGNLTFETGMAGEHRPWRFACYCGVTEAPARPRYFRVSRRSLRPSPLQASSSQRRACPAENLRLAPVVSQDSAKDSGILPLA